MTYYHHQVLNIRERDLPKQYLVDRVIKAKHTIDKCFCDEINLDLISAESCLSKFHLIRLFKICYGKTPYQFITEKRIVRAKQLLKEGLGVSETCLRLGFSSPGSFSLYFKKNTGLTPTAYKSNF